MNKTGAPSLPSGVAPQLRIFLTWVRERLCVGGMKKSVTFEDLVIMGVVPRDKAEKRANE